MSKNTRELGLSLRRKRNELGLSLTNLRNLIGVSQTTLSRTENNVGKLDAENLQKITAWLGEPITNYLGEGAKRPVIYVPDRPTVEIVDQFLRNDNHLTKAGKEALSRIFHLAYDYLSKSRSRRGRFA